MMKIKFSFLLAFFMLVSCGEKQEEQVVPEQIDNVEISQLHLSPESFDNFSDWNKDKVESAVEAFERSCEKILQEKGEYLGKSRIKILTAAYQDVCKVLPMYKPEQYREFLEKNFVPYAISYKGSDVGKFTAYYEMMFLASRNKNHNFSFPIYNRPADLLEVNLHDFDENLPNKQLVGRLVGQKLVPYYTREEINKMGTYLRATPIVFANSAVDVFILQIQGSGVAVFEDGTQLRLAYAANNGHPFKGIGSILLEKGEIDKKDANMMRIKQWLNQNYVKALQYMNENPRYVFHRQVINKEGPLGAQGVPLTAGRSLAVDTDYIPLGSLLWLETFYPDKADVGKLVVAQDVGSAIKGPIRGDYFWGTGGDDILRLAGSMNAGGRYFILVPKGAEVKVQ